MQKTLALFGGLILICLAVIMTLPEETLQITAQAIALFATGGLVASLALGKSSKPATAPFEKLAESHSQLMGELGDLKNQLAAAPANTNTAELDVLKSIIAELSQAKDPSPDVAVANDITVHDEGDDIDVCTSEGELILFDDEEDQKEEKFSSLDRLELLEMVKDALKKDRVDVLLQPIVSLPQRKPRFYECFSRLRTEDGSILVPDHFLEMAEGEGLMSAVDNALLFKCIQLVRRARKRGADIKFFCNISGSSLRDAEFLKSFTDFIEINKELKPWIFFEIKEDVMLSPDPLIQAGLQKLVDIKCRFSLDQMTDLDINTRTLQKLGVRFVKINCRALSCNDDEFKRLKDLRQKLEALRIDVIATKLEDEEQLKEILDFNVDYGQGYLFNPPQICKI